MSPTSRRFVAAVVAATIAVLTGIAVGLTSPQRTCRVAATSPLPAPTPTATATGAAGLTDAEGAAPTAGSDTGTAADNGVDGDRTGNTTGNGARPAGRQLAAAQVRCSVQPFEAVPAVVGVVGGLAAGTAVFVLLLGAERRRHPLPARPGPQVGGSAPGGPAPVRPGPAGTGPGRPRPRVEQPPPGRPAADTDHTTTALPTAIAPPIGAPPVGTVVGAGAADADRAALIRACIYVRDRTTSRALADRLGTALHDAGVRTVEPAGARFDPARHEAGGAAPSGDPAKIGTIAAVEVPGYADRDGRLLRVPVVTVYRAATTTEREDR